MPLTKKEIAGLMRLIALTKDEEIDCEQCLSQMAEFAEHEWAGGSILEGLQTVEHHLSICAECREEHEALKRALKETHR